MEKIVFLDFDGTLSYTKDTVIDYLRGWLKTLT